MHGKIQLFHLKNTSSINFPYFIWLSKSALFFLIFTSLSLIQEEWKLTRDKEGIRVFVGKDSQNMLRPYRAEVTVEASTDEIVALLRDVDRFPEWVHLCIESALIEKKSENDFSVYYVNKAPWPFRNRDNCTRIQIENRDNGDVFITLRDFPDLKPPIKSRVRIPFLEGYWHLQFIDKDKTKITQQVHANPGGSVPNWLVNMSVVDTPFNTLRNMRTMLE